jgi:hypothetical protein
MNSELEKTWKEVVMAQFKVLPWHLPEGLGKTMKTLSG